MKPHLIVIFLSLKFWSFGQFVDSSLFSKLKFHQGIELSAAIGPTEFGVKYNYMCWKKEGYKNYSSLYSGVSLFPNRYSRGRAFGFEAGLNFNARISLSKPCYISMGFAYQGLVPIDESNSVYHDDYVNGGKILIGLNGFVNRLKIHFQTGLGIVEQKQDLVFSVHTYARLKAETMIHIGFFFDQKKD